MKVVNFIFYDSGEQFIFPDDWIPGEQADQIECYPGQAKSFCTKLYRAVVRKGIEALTEETLDLPVLIYRQGNTIDFVNLEGLPNER
jgi:hypothetical protein